MGQAINLDSKYAKTIQQAFTIGSLIQGRLSNDVDFVGAKTVRIHTVNTVPVNDYDRTATANRYGTPAEVGDSVQELTMTQDKSFTGVIDKGNNLDQCINKAGKFLGIEMKEEVIPMKDRHAFKVLSNQAGKIVGSTDAISATNVIARMSAARAYMLNKRVPTVNRTWYITTGVFNALLDCKQFTSLEKLGEKALITGQVGEIFKAPVVEVPDDLLPAGVNFLLVYKHSASSPSKINDSNVHIDPPGYSGNLVEGRFYWDTFVFAQKASGIYVDVTTSADVSVLAAPTIAAATGAITAAAGCTVKYTIDGTDPRYSMSAQVGTAAGTGKGKVVKAYQYKDGAFPSGVAEVTLTA